MIKTIDLKPLIKKRRGILAMKIKLNASRNKRILVIPLLAKKGYKSTRKGPIILLLDPYDEEPSSLEHIFLKSYYSCPINSLNSSNVIGKVGKDNPLLRKRQANFVTFGTPN